MSQSISLQDAIAMTTVYRNEKENILAPEYRGQNILATCETFDRDIVDTLLAKAGCSKLRIYYGMDEDLKVHAVLIAANEKGEDILGSSGTTSMELGGGDVGGENSYRCPPECPPPSPLNP